MIQKVVKRDNTTIVDYNRSKIRNALEKASMGVSVDGQISDAEIEDIISYIENKYNGEEVHVESIQNEIENRLMFLRKYELAREYITYRYKRALVRKANTTDNSILALLENKNAEVMKENSNKKASINSTKRDLIAGEVSKDLCDRFLLPKDVSDAHKTGKIHFHDRDYFMQKMFNCFNRDTRFVTDEGVKTFHDFNDGEEVNVLAMDGKWRRAIVRQYGKQKMQLVTLKSYRTQKEVICTQNHRWILADGTVTTSLKVGMDLYPLQECDTDFGICTWKVESIVPYQNGKDFCAWCVEEPVTHSFTLEGGVVTGNCCLPNFRDMLENGTCINGVKITTPKSFGVACNQITQIMATVASNQYGGQTFYSDVLGKYLAYTREKFRKRITATTNTILGNDVSEELKKEVIEALVQEELMIELKAGIQCIQYQINTMATSNGQAPFVTVFMYLDKDDPYIEENAMIIEEILKQRIQGIPDRSGKYVTPTFPKLIYCITEDSNLTGGKYDYLTHLAAECSVLRMYPDYISEKVMMENYNGEVFGCMGCVDGPTSMVSWKWNNKHHATSIEEMWNTLVGAGAEVKEQMPGNPDYLYIDTNDVMILDMKYGGYVKNRRLIRNKTHEWIHIEFDNGVNLSCTHDHPIPTENRGNVRADELTVEDIVLFHDVNEATVDIVEHQIHPVGITKYVNDGYSYDVTSVTDHFTVNGIYSHNCRSFLSAWVDPKTGEYQWEGRFNQGVVTLNLPQIALASDKDEEKFWEIMEDHLTLCFEALMCRHRALEGTMSDVSPIHWQDGAIARLKPGETIDHLLHDGYSTISLGYIGLSECVYHMKGCSHTTDGGREFSLRVMKRLKAACESWKAATGIAFGLYGTPAESTCYTLLKKDREQFGIVEGVTDRDYYTNSYHINVREEINAFDKLSLESIYQKISSGGAISYVEIPNMTNNVEAVEELIKFIYEYMQYAEFNTRSDHCNKCGFEGEIRSNENNEWECPNCHNTDVRYMSISRRTCGYLGTAEAGWNDGKMQEFNERVMHLY